MNMRSIVLSSLLITSYVAADNYGIYYSEFKTLKEEPKNQLLFNQERSGGSHTDQCNIESYRPSLQNEQSLAFFATMNLMRKNFSLGDIQREIAMGKELSLLQLLLQIGLSDSSDLIIVAPKTMPRLYGYVDSISKQANISTPVVFVSLKQDFFKSFSRKILMFKGSIVIGQELLESLSDEELEAVVAQEIGHIKYNHSNKTYVLQVAALSSLVYLSIHKLLEKNNFDSAAINLQAVGIGAGLLRNKLVSMIAVPALASLLVSKRFAKHADLFASKVGKSNGIISLYERLEVRDQLRAEEFDAIADSLRDNSADITLLHYVGLLIYYYAAKTEQCIAGVYNKFAYPSHQERIAAAQEYLASQEA